jgi:hypothetical protein
VGQAVNVVFPNPDKNKSPSAMPWGEEIQALVKVARMQHINSNWMWDSPCNLGTETRELYSMSTATLIPTESLSLQGPCAGIMGVFLIAAQLQTMRKIAAA